MSIDLLDVSEPLHHLGGTARYGIEGTWRTVGDGGRVNHHQAVLHWTILQVTMFGYM